MVKEINPIKSTVGWAKARSPTFASNTIVTTLIRYVSQCALIAIHYCQQADK